MKGNPYHQVHTRNPDRFHQPPYLCILIVAQQYTVSAIRVESRSSVQSLSTRSMSLADADEQRAREMQVDLSVPAVTLDECREQMFIALRSTEQFLAVFRPQVEAVENLTNKDSWLEHVHTECFRGIQFFEQRLSTWNEFSKKVHAYWLAVRNEATQQALQELKVRGNTEEPEDEQDGSGDTDEQDVDPAQHSDANKPIHPELVKFKLEKQAKILGKYGGVPALGMGLVLPRAPRNTILKATASPAAVEIHYSKTEDKDARYLAQVMQFKTKKDAEEAPSPWQAEVSAKKQFKPLDNAEPDKAPTFQVTNAYTAELAGALQQRQATVAAAELEAAEATQKAAKEPTTPGLGSANDELAIKLKRRQSAVNTPEFKTQEPDAEEPPPLAWSNTKQPFGNELTAALQKRQSKAGIPPAAGASTSQGGTMASPQTPAPSTNQQTPKSVRPTPPMKSFAATPTAEANNELLEKLRKRQSLAEGAPSRVP